MCHKTKYDIHFCTDDEKTVAYELAAMEDFEAIHPDSQVNRHQDIKNWETFYYAASRLIDECTTIVATQDVITQHYRFFEIAFKKSVYDSKNNLMRRAHLSFDSSVVSETAPSSRSVTT